MSLRSPVGDTAAEALQKVRPDLLAVVPRALTKRQQQALAAWERLGEVTAVADELGISESSVRQLLAAAGALRTRPGHSRRCAVVLLKEGKTAAEVQKELGLHHRVLEFAINDYAYELLEREGGELPSNQRIGYARSRRRAW